MRNVIIIATLAALTATPALANTRHDWRQAPVSLAGSQEYVSDLAVKGGNVMGQDPDAHVRFELRRNNPGF